MTPSFVVKVCGVTNKQDAQTAVNAGANAIGFNFYRQSSRFITPLSAATIAAAVTGDYLRVGVFVHPSTEELSAISKTVGLDVVQIHGRLPQNIPARMRLWRAIGPTIEPPPEIHDIEAYLLDTPSPHFGGTGQTFNWNEVASFRGRAILAGGLHSGNVQEAINAAHPWGVDACSRIEISPGKKDAQRVEEFVKAALVAQRNSVNSPSEITS